MSYQIDGSIGLDSTWRGNMYTVQYKVQAESKNLFDQFVSYGSNATNLPGRPISVPCYVYKCGTKYVKPHWFYTFQICDSNYAWERTYIPQNINQIVKEYGLVEIQLLPEWFGLRVASKEDAGWDSTTNKYGKSKMLNIYGDPCTTGDWLFINTTTKNKGYSNQSKSPFKTVPSIASLNLNQLFFTTKTVTYTVSFSTGTNTEWKGVNGNWGPGCAPNDTTAGIWKAVDSKTQNYSQGGATKWRTTRRVIKAPKFGTVQLIWDAAVNGGTWTWQA